MVEIFMKNRILFRVSVSKTFLNHLLLCFYVWRFHTTFASGEYNKPWSCSNHFAMTQATFFNISWFMPSKPLRAVEDRRLCAGVAWHESSAKFYIFIFAFFNFLMKKCYILLLWLLKMSLVYRSLKYWKMQNLFWELCSFPRTPQFALNFKETNRRQNWIIPFFCSSRKQE